MPNPVIDTLIYKHPCSGRDVFCYIQLADSAMSKVIRIINMTGTILFYLLRHPAECRNPLVYLFLAFEYRNVSGQHPERCFSIFLNEIIIDFSILLYCYCHHSFLQQPIPCIRESQYRSNTLCHLW